MEIALGMKVKDVITGFAGIVTGFTEYISGCKQALVVPPVGSDGSYKDGQWFDRDRLAILDSSVITLKITNDGADKPAPKR
jgi:hypothetical protein